MAIDAHSTPAPAVQPGLLRTWTGAVPVPMPAFTVETVAMLDAIPPLARHGGAGDAAQALHMRRALEGALDHGTALLAALGLPSLVEPGFVPLDPAAIGDALDTAIATLDALDAPAEDLEDGHDAEHDLADAEHDLGWPACVSQVNLGRNTDDGDITALERHGRGFLRSGPDDAEDGGDAERDEDHGSENGEDIGHFARDWRSVIRDIQRKREAAHG